MATTFHVLYVPGISCGDAESAEAQVAATLQAIGLLSDCTHRHIDQMGSKIRRYSASVRTEELFHKREPDGFGVGDYAESTVGRYANGWSLNSVGEYGCPSCGERFRWETGRKAFDEILSDMKRAVIDFMDSGKVCDVRCPTCATPCSAAHWYADIPPAFAHLAFEFSDFPPFNTNAITIPEALFGYGEWRVDVPRVFQDAVRQPIGWSMGRI
jgi:hypothetical protein